MRLIDHGFLVSVDCSSIPTACSLWLCCWTHLRGRGAAWQGYQGSETDMSLVRMLEDSAYEFCLTRILRRLLRAILKKKNAQNLIFFLVDLSCFEYPFPTAQFCTRCNHFQDSMDFEHNNKKRNSFSPVFVPCHCVVAFIIFIRDCACYYVLVDCPERRCLKTHRAFVVPTPLIFAYYSKRVFKDRFHLFIFTTTMSELASSAALQLLRIATEGVLGNYCVYDLV